MSKKAAKEVVCLKEMSRALNLAEDFKNIINYDKNILEWIKVSDFVVIDAYKNVTSSKVI